jgi:hypothetical protein
VKFVLSVDDDGKLSFALEPSDDLASARQLVVAAQAHYDACWRNAAARGAFQDWPDP